MRRKLLKVLIRGLSALIQQADNARLQKDSKASITLSDSASESKQWNQEFIFGLDKLYESLDALKRRVENFSPGISVPDSECAFYQDLPTFFKTTVFQMLLVNSSQLCEQLTNLNNFARLEKSDEHSQKQCKSEYKPIRKALSKIYEQIQLIPGQVQYLKENSADLKESEESAREVPTLFENTSSEFANSVRNLTKNLRKLQKYWGQENFILLENEIKKECDSALNSSEETAEEKRRKSKDVSAELSNLNISDENVPNKRESKKHSDGEQNKRSNSDTDSGKSAKKRRLKNNSDEVISTLLENHNCFGESVADKTLKNKKRRTSECKSDSSTNVANKSDKKSAETQKILENAEDKKVEKRKSGNKGSGNESTESQKILENAEDKKVEKRKSGSKGSGNESTETQKIVENAENKKVEKRKSGNNGSGNESTGTQKSAKKRRLKNNSDKVISTLLENHNCFGESVADKTPKNKRRQTSECKSDSSTIVANNSDKKSSETQKILENAEEKKVEKRKSGSKGSGNESTETQKILENAEDKKVEKRKSGSNGSGNKSTEMQKIVENAENKKVEKRKSGCKSSGNESTETQKIVENAENKKVEKRKSGSNGSGNKSTEMQKIVENAENKKVEKRKSGCKSSGNESTETQKIVENAENKKVEKRKSGSNGSGNKSTEMQKIVENAENKKVEKRKSGSKGSGNESTETQKSAKKRRLKNNSDEVISTLLGNHNYFGESVADKTPKNKRRQTSECKSDSSTIVANNSDKKSAESQKILENAENKKIEKRKSGSNNEGTETQKSAKKRKSKHNSEETSNVSSKDVVTESEITSTSNENRDKNLMDLINSVSSSKEDTDTRLMNVLNSALNAVIKTEAREYDDTENRNEENTSRTYLAEDFSANICYEIINDEELDEDEKFLYIQVVMEEANDNRMPDAKIQEKLRSLMIDTDWEIPTAHLIKGSLVRGSKPEDTRGLDIVKTPFTSKESEIILKNWRQFCRMYGFSQDPTPFLNFQYGYKRYISFEERKKFVQFLGKGLPQRTLTSIYLKFKTLVKNQLYKLGRFAPEEDELIRLYVSRVGEKRKPFLHLENILKRSRVAIEHRYTNLKKQQRVTNKVNWTTEQLEQLLKLLMRETNSNNVSDLQNLYIQGDVYRKIADIMDIPHESVKSKWEMTLYTRLFSQIPLNLHQIKIKLIKRLCKQNVTDWKLVDWKQICTHFPGCSKKFIYHLAKVLVYSIPKERQKDFKDMRRYLGKYTALSLKSNPRNYTIRRLRLNDAGNLEEYEQAKNNSKRRT